MDAAVMSIVIIAIVLVVIIALVVFLISAYNRLVSKRNSVEEGWKQIHVQEQERLDSISQLVNTVKGYAEHEKGIFDKFAAARGAFDDALKEGSANKLAESHTSMDQAMLNIRAVGEAYPELKADANFRDLQDQVTSVERKIASARRYYNSSVREFNESRQVFPTNVVAGVLGFREDKEYFEIDEKAARERPNISF